ncbi:hypothetical protein C8R43DRAFT_951968 [Mycena crocata]|nr:hypothetical protein C8R43DRAFT_951968 [Mycena crocata]
MDLMAHKLLGRPESTRGIVFFLKCSVKAGQIVFRLKKAIGVDAKRTLAVLARTSSIFLHPALNTLWRGQDTLEYLYSLFPRDMHQRITPNLERGKKQWPSHLADWEHVLFYSQKIRYVSIEPRGIRNLNTADHFTTQFLSAIIFAPFYVDGIKVFPKLQRLRWDTPANLDYILYLLGPQLERLHIGLQHAGELRHLMSSTGTHCPSLTHLHVTGASWRGGSTSPKGTMLFRFISRLKYLQHLDMDDLKWITLDNLQKLPGVKSFTVRQPPETLHMHAWAARAPLLTPTHSAGSTSMTDARGCTVVTKFAMHSLFDVTKIQNLDVDLHRFHSRLAEQYSPSSLTNLSIIHTPATHPMLAASLPSDSRRVPATAERIQQMSVDLQTLEPLLCFHNLVEVQLVDGLGFALDNIAVEALARAWPRLGNLSLGDARLGWLAVNATVVPELELVEVRQDCLAVVEVSNLAITSEIHDEGGVAEFLSKIFPALHTTCGWPGVELVLQEKRRRRGRAELLLRN